MTAPRGGVATTQHRRTQQKCSRTDNDGHRKPSYYTTVETTTVEQERNERQPFDYLYYGTGDYHRKKFRVLTRRDRFFLFVKKENRKEEALRPTLSTSTFKPVLGYHRKLDVIIPELENHCGPRDPTCAHTRARTW